MTTIITKNSSTASAVPVAGDLTKGELAVNVTDKKLYTKDNGGSVVKLVGSLGNQEASAVAITGGAIDGTPIGGTTASTASFTTVSASGNVTLSGGTANGVLYLNGSKVATSGSALTFDGTNLGVGTNSPLSVGGYTFTDMLGSTGAQYRARTTTVDLRVGADASLAFVSSTNSSLWFGANNAEAMRLTSTGLGIGTSSPTQKLEILTAVASSTPAAIFRAPSGVGNTGGLAFYHNDTNANARNWYLVPNSNAYGDFVIKVGTSQGANPTTGTDVATFNSSGNLGLGVTPSAWLSTIKAFQFGASGSLFGNPTITNVGLQNNAYYGSGGWTFIGTNYALQYQQSASNGQHQWYTSTASGTAGNAITFTQAMTLTAEGNLGLGQTNPTNISNYKTLTISAPTGSLIDLQSNSVTGLRLQCDTTYPGGAIYALTNNPLVFGTNSTERARIDSSGNFLLGLSAQTNTPANGIVAQNLTATSQILIGHINGSGSGTYYEAYFYNGSAIGSITQSGTTAVLFNVTSDQRLKENIVDAPEFGSVIDSIKVRSYDWKSDGNHQRAGFVAQELVTVAPEAVHQPADPEEMMAVDYSKLVPMLVKEIQSLRKRLADAGIA